MESVGLRAPFRLPAAVLWDMDGTLIDSEPYWMAAESALATRFGVRWTHDDGLNLVGRTLPASAQIMADKGVEMDNDAIVEAMLVSVIERIKERVPWQSDAHDALQRVTDAGIPCALVTMSYMEFVVPVLAQVPGVFGAVVTGDEAIVGKPDPAPYLLACERLGVSPSDCVVVEDSVSGVASGLASGARTVAVRRFIDIPSVPGLSRVSSLADLDLATLARIAGGDVIDNWEL